MIAGVGTEAPTVDPTETDGACNRCGASTAVTYQDGRLYLVCTECEGDWETGADQSRGVLIGAGTSTRLASPTAHLASCGPR